MKKISPQALEDQNNFDQIPLDLVIEIVGRLPSKSVARFLLVSKSWETFIRSRDFITSFPLGSSSSSQPRLLITFSDSNYIERRQNLDFFSSSSSATSLISRFTRQILPPEYKECLPQFVNGLVSLGLGEEQTIFNPTTGKSITLPKVVTWRKIVKTYFGYDPVNDQYKVLCLTELHDNHRNFQLSHDKVFTLGERESWRVMDCSIRHRPWSNGLCIDGVLYYLANTGVGLLRQSLMRFDVRSEKLDLLTDLPVNLIAPYVYVYTLMKYEGKVAIATEASIYPLHTFNVWVMEEHGWLRTSFSIEPYCRNFEKEYIHIKGTTRMGEIILAPHCASKAFCVILYNPKSNSRRNIKIEVNSDYEFTTRYPKLIVLPDYVENIRFF